MVHIFKAQECIGRISNFLQSVQEYNATYHYIPGLKNHVADYLSRAPEIEEEDTVFPTDQQHQPADFVNLNERQMEVLIPNRICVDPLQRPSILTVILKDEDSTTVLELSDSQNPSDQEEVNLFQYFQPWSI